MQPLLSILDQDLVQTQLHFVSKKRALETISASIAKRNSALEAETLFKALMARERLGSTGIGHGIAIPHCRAPEITQCIMGVFCLAQPIKFNTLDNQPVDIFIVLVVPENEPKAHLELLAIIAERFKDQTFCTKIRQALTANEVYQLIIHYDI